VTGNRDKKHGGRAETPQSGGTMRRKRYTRHEKIYDLFSNDVVFRINNDYTVHSSCEGTVSLIVQYRSQECGKARGCTSSSAFEAMRNERSSDHER
jgi:hypothetical protein